MSYRHIRRFPAARGEPVRGPDGRFAPRPFAVQRKDMKTVMNEQYQREAEISGEDYRKEAGTGHYTTVGFEWDIAQTAEDSEESPNPLQGLSHVEIAQSELRWNGLPYLLETDAGNVLELVTPPFYIETEGPGKSLPQGKDLTDVKDAMRGGLQGAVEKGITIRDLVKKEDWKTFEIGAWRSRKLLQEVAASNWSWRAKPGADVATDLKTKKIGDVVLAEETLSAEPQINVALDPLTFESLEDRSKSRVKEGDVGAQIKVLYDANVAKLERIVEPQAKTNPRLRTFLAQLCRVLAQQHAVPSLKALGALQEEGWKGGEVGASQMKGVANTASFVKDTSNLWLKTDLVSFGLGTLQAGDWPTVVAAVDLLASFIGKSGIGKTLKIEGEEEGEVRGLVLGVLEKLKTKATELIDADDYGTQVAALIGEIGRQKRGLNQQNPELLGVRQDTFISPGTMRKLSGKLNLGSQLYVMELRNPEKDLGWLRGNKRKKAALEGGELPEVSFDDLEDILEEVEAQPLIDLDGGILPTAVATFSNAYRDDVRASTAYLTEAEGAVIADEMGIAVNLFRGAQPPPGFAIVPNDGGGNCLIHSLLHARQTSMGRRRTSASAAYVAHLRGVIADHLDAAYVLALCAAAVRGRLTGDDEVGLGPNMVALLGRPSIAQARRRIQLGKEPPKKKEPETTSSTTKPETAKKETAKKETAKKAEAPQALAPLAMPQLGTGVPLADQAVLHTGGAHYVMIRRT
jgi:hypothetical protein